MYRHPSLYLAIDRIQYDYHSKGLLKLFGFVLRILNKLTRPIRSSAGRYFEKNGTVGGIVVGLFNLIEFVFAAIKWLFMLGLFAGLVYCFVWFVRVMMGAFGFWGGIGATVFALVVFVFIPMCSSDPKSYDRSLDSMRAIDREYRAKDMASQAWTSGYFQGKRDRY